MGYDVSDDQQQKLLREGRSVPFMISTLLCRADAVRRVGEFDESLITHEDLEFVALIARQGRVATLMEPLAQYIVNPGSTSQRVFRQRYEVARFVVRRLEARARGSDLTWEEFKATDRASFREHWSELSNYWYRAAGTNAVQRHFVAATGYFVLASVMSPVRTARRLGRILRASLGEHSG
jgi:hypothetical protein